MHKIFIIAEAGVNHNGSLKLAKKLVDSAHACGADAVKFQTFKTEKLVTRSARKAEYQMGSSLGTSQYDMLKKLELSEKDFKELFKYCKKRKIQFISTPFDEESALFLDRLGVGMFKISSGDLTNLPLLKFVAKLKKKILLSTGMSYLREVKEAVAEIKRAGNYDVVLLHCTSNYPAKYEDVNLKAIWTLRNAFKLPVGYSDHTGGIEIAVAAAAMGATVVEKHFTLSTKMKGPDHKASIDAPLFKKMVMSIRITEKALGDGIKKPVKSEMNVKKVARKSVVAETDIPKGTKIRKQMISIKRPGTGIPPKYYEIIIGKIAKKEIKKDSVIKWEHIK